MTLITDAKFKTVLINFNFFIDAKHDELALINVLTTTLLTATKDHPTKQALTKHLNLMYQTYIEQSNYIFSNQFVVNFSVGFPSPKVIDDPNLVDQIIDLINQILFDRTPFDEKIVESVKKDALERLRQINDLKTLKGHIRFIEHAFAGHFLSYPRFGTFEDIQKITKDSLYEYYQSWIKKAQLRIYGLGDLTLAQANKIKTAFLHLESNQPINIQPFMYPTKPKPSEVIEYDNLHQALIYKYFSFNIDRHHPLYFAAHVALYILGGYPNSRLFLLLREKYHLAYEVDATYDFTKLASFIYAVVDVKNATRAIEIIDEICRDLVENGPSNDELKSAKSSLCNLIILEEDHQANLLYSKLIKDVYQINDTTEDRLRLINQVSISDIKDVLLYHNLQTTYTLSGNGVDRDEDLWD